MQDAVHALQQGGWLSLPVTPATRAQAVSREAQQRQAQALHERARQAEPQITPLLKDILSHGGVPGREEVRQYLAGEQHRLKSPQSLQDKLARLIGGMPPLDLAQASARVNDALRYSAVLPADTFVADYRRILLQLDGKAHAMMRCHNHFSRERSAFRAVSVTLEDPEGFPWEIQFHTEQTFGCKEKYHDLYKQAQRRQSDGAHRDEIWKLLEPARKDFRALAVPAGVEDIVDWEPEPEPEPVLTVPPRPQPQAPAARDMPSPLAGLARQISSQAERLEDTVWPVLQPALEGHGAKLRTDLDGGGWRKFIYAEPATAGEGPGGPMNPPYRGAAPDQARSSERHTWQPSGPHHATRSAPVVAPRADPGHAVRSSWGPRHPARTARAQPPARPPLAGALPAQAPVRRSLQEFESARHYGSLEEFLGQSNAEMGVASGVGNNCLLDTVLQFVRNIRRQPGVDTEQTRELEAQAQALRSELIANDLADEHDFIDMYPGGARLARSLDIRIQTIEVEGSGQVTAHPVVGQQGRLVHILHTPNHFQPLWPRPL
ncbi:hypothetical protein [Cupriavidus sp. UYPR2.512]|uniref:hypothetical protein n=1 Tax=Cupriavidus sp. UYPR2.512 TaxID=1080187 RepID=UPI001E2F1665|nr:hypothetical protein [Cupriavidus sp. UYPR2.512]